MQTLINRSGNNLDLALVFSYQKDKRPVLKKRCWSTMKTGKRG